MKEMRCIFCKERSDGCISVEHILPESIGNKDALLPVGVVCDKCNNYLSREVERPLLESGILRLIRDERGIRSKRGRIPSFGKNDNPALPDYRIMGRFIGKVGLECLADRVRKVEGGNDEIVDKSELDELRQFVRFNKGSYWPFSYRTLYPVNAAFKESEEIYEVLHEYDLLYTDGFEIYIILVLFGVEFAMNLGGRLIDGYRHWLEKNEWSSPLYTGKNLSDVKVYYFKGKEKAGK